VAIDADSPAVPGLPPDPVRPRAPVILAVDTGSTQAVVSGAIGRTGVLAPVGAVTLAASGAEGPPLGSDPGSLVRSQADLKALSATSKDPADQGTPPSSAGGSSMMPFMMPMGMGMGMSADGGAAGRTRAASVSADGVEWEDDPKPGGGEGVLGRKPKPPDENELLTSLIGGSYV
jgi:hypothetical protein